MAKPSELKPDMTVSFTSKWTDATTGKIVSVGTTMSKILARSRDHVNFQAIAVPNKDIKVPKAKAPVTATDEGLRAEIVKLAHENPELRAHLVPLLKTSSQEAMMKAIKNAMESFDESGRADSLMNFLMVLQIFLRKSKTSSELECEKALTLMVQSLDRAIDEAHLAVEFSGQGTVLDGAV